MLLTFALFVGVAVASLGLVVVTAIRVFSADLPDPARLEQLDFAQPTVVYDRSGKIVLGTFEREQRRVVTFDQIPKLVLDATTSAEDRTFWDNSGFDPRAIVAAAIQNVTGTSSVERGASTITQQLVRARLLTPQDSAPNADPYVRKIREIIQSARLTSAFPGEEGKQRIITAYLNQIFYGHGAYGIAAAAKIYFGVSDLSKLTASQAALLAGLPRSPTTLDPYLFAKKDAKGHLVVSPDSPPVQRRDWVLQNLEQARWTALTPAQVQAAIAEPVILAGVQPVHWQAPQYTWQVRQALANIVGGAQAVDTGGYRVITSLDWHAQQVAEKWVTAAAIVPNLAPTKATALLKQLKIPSSDLAWIDNLRGKDVHNAALVAIDYRTGDVLAYVGSAGFYRSDLASPKFDPQFDVLSYGYRQPGSAWKPVLYSTAFQSKVLTPGSMLLDITTQFGKTPQGQPWAPTDADQLERGPVLVRQALQYSLNIPAIRALQRVGSLAVANEAARMGITFQGGKPTYLQAGLAGAIGTVEVRPIDLVSAYGTIADGGQRVPPRLILKVIAPDGHVVYQAPTPKPKQVLDRGAAFLVSNILEGNTDPGVNQFWGPVLALRNGPNGERRPAAAKTGTTNDTRDLATYGYLPPPTSPAQPGLAVGVWMGNSDHSNPQTKTPAISLQGPAPLWQAFVQDYTKGRPLAEFTPPDNVVQATIDAWSGGAPGPWTRRTTNEWFLVGTQPGASRQVDKNGLLYSRSCGGWAVDPVGAELGPQSWLPDVEDWVRRARGGPGIKGHLGGTTAYFWGRYSWGGPIMGRCAPKPSPSPDNQGPGGQGPGGQGPPGQGGGDGKGHGHGGGATPGGGGPSGTPLPVATPAPTAGP